MKIVEPIPPAVADSWAQNAHVLCGICAVWGPAALFPAASIAPLIGFCLIVVFAALKEFVYDPRFETPAESGGNGGDWEDFSHYVVGAVVALILLFVAHYYVPYAGTS